MLSQKAQHASRIIPIDASLATLHQLFTPSIIGRQINLNDLLQIHYGATTNYCYGELVGFDELRNSIIYSVCANEVITSNTYLLSTLLIGINATRVYVVYACFQNIPHTCSNKYITTKMWFSLYLLCLKRTQSS